MTIPSLDYLDKPRKGRKIQKRYNPEQPRDEGGKWTSGGGGLGAEFQAIRDAPMVKPSESEQDEFVTMHDEVIAVANQEMDGIPGLEEARYQWQSAGWRGINGSIDDDGSITADHGDPVRRDIAALDEAISRTDKTILQSMYGGDDIPVVVYRGAMNLEDVQVGDTISMRGYTATSVSPLEAMKFSHSAGDTMSSGAERNNKPVLEIQDVQHGLPMGGSEMEIVLPRGMELQVTGRRVQSMENGDIEVLEAKIVKHGVTDGGASADDEFDDEEFDEGDFDE